MANNNHLVGNGNRTAKAGMQAGAVLGATTEENNALDISYSYDVRGQLLEERRNGAPVRYAYDKAGNRIKKTGARGEISYFYNEKNQLLREETENAEKQFTYDRQGGIIKEKNPSGIRHFSYDSRHRQTKVETEDGNVQENRYDSEDLRFELLENGKRTRFVYHDGELLHEEGGKENRQTGYHLGVGIEAFTRAEETYYYQQDEQLSTAFITGRNGVVHNSYQYDAFGNELETAGQLYNRIRYTGQQYDDATGQYYLRARYYNPVLGRFMQEDTYQGDGLNLYAYCKNNPVTYYDPSGYACGDLGIFAGDGSNTSDKYQVGIYDELKTKDGMDKHHVGQKAIMRKLVQGYNEKKAPAIVVPRKGHTIKGKEGIVCRNTKGIDNARQLLARDLFELKRVYPDIPNSAYRELIDMNMKMYPEMRKK